MERSLLQENLKAKSLFEHHEFLGKLIQEEAEKLQNVEPQKGTTEKHSASKL